MRSRAGWGLAALLVLAGCGGGGIKGTAQVVDRAGDPRSRAGEPSARVPPGPDLVRVRLTADGEKLAAVFTSATPVTEFVREGKFGQGPGWFLALWTDQAPGPPAYVAGILPKPNTGKSLIDSLRVYLCEGGGACTEELPTGEVSVSGANLEIRVPLESMPTLSDTFLWVASTSWNPTRNRDKGWSDFAPDVGPDPSSLNSARAPRARFPR